MCKFQEVRVRVRDFPVDITAPREGLVQNSSPVSAYSINW